MVGYYKEICTDNTLKDITQEELDTLITYLDEVVLASKEVKCIDILRIWRAIQRKFQQIARHIYRSIHIHT
jgi:hypothetical protein